MDIGAWLRELGLERYEQAFLSNEVGPDVLPQLTAEDLKEIGVIPVGDRRRLLEAIASFEVPSGQATTPAESSEIKPAGGEAERRQLTVIFPNEAAITRRVGAILLEGAASPLHDPGNHRTLAR